MGDDGLVRLGRVIKPHGIRGELVVEPEGDTLTHLEAGAVLAVNGQPHRLAGMRPHQGRLLVRLDGCADRTQAEALRGAAVTMSAAHLPAPGDDEWYADTLIGWELVDADGSSVGRVTSVLPGGVHDYLQIDGDALVPMVKDWLVAVDEPARRLTMRLPRGLIEPEAK